MASCVGTRQLVCAEDGNEYHNRCFANCNMMTQVADGPCVQLGAEIETEGPRLASMETAAQVTEGSADGRETQNLVRDDVVLCTRSCHIGRDPVCAADGTSYHNECFARCHGCAVFTGGLCDGSSSTSTTDASQIRGDGDDVGSSSSSTTTAEPTTGVFSTWA